MNSAFKDWRLLNRLKSFNPLRFFSSLDARPNAKKWTTAILLFIFLELWFAFQNSVLVPLLIPLLLVSFGLLAQLHVQKLSRQLFWQTLKTVLSLSWKVLPLLIGVQLFVGQIYSRRIEDSQHGAGALSGFGLLLKPGSIESVTLIDEVSYRVQTDPRLPSPEATYWRVGMLAVSRGLTWEGPEDLFTSVQPACAEVKRIQSKVFPADPDHSDWQRQPPAVSLFQPQRFYILEQKGIPKTFATAACQTSSVAEGTDRMKKYLELDPALTSQSYQRALLSKLGFGFSPQKIKLEPSHFIRGLARFFQANPFRYSTRPKAISGGPAEELEAFLFRTQEGFCEHFAASVATLARIAGIPSRIVLGFYRPEWNSYGNYWTLSSKNAHAWVELWGPEGWQELDPTLWASAQGVPKEKSLFLALDHLFSQLWDALNFYFQAQVLSASDWKSPVGFCALLLFIFVGLLLLRKQVRRFGRFRRKSKIERDFEKLMTRLAHSNLGRLDRETLEHYRSRLAQIHPNDEIQSKFKFYLMERFGPGSRE